MLQSTFPFVVRSCSRGTTITAGGHRYRLHRQVSSSSVGAAAAAAAAATSGGSSRTASSPSMSTSISFESSPVSPLIARSMNSNLNPHHHHHHHHHRLDNHQRYRHCGCTSAEDRHRQFFSTSIDSSSSSNSSGTGGLSSFGGSTSSNSQGSIVDMEYDGVSDADAALINRHAKKVQTSVSLQALMRTGRGEFLHKTFDEESVAVDDHTATELVLMQVRMK